MRRPETGDTVTIGGATITVARPSPAGWSFDRAHVPFCTAGGSPRLDLSVELLGLQKGGAPATAFASARAAWRVDRTARGWRLAFHDEAGTLHRVVDVDRAWRRGSIAMAFRPGDDSRPFPLDYPVEQLLFVSLLAHAEGAVVHAAGVVVDGLAWVFAGTHGQGKSTLARLFSRRRGLGILNDDRVVVRRVGGRWLAFGTPWAGTVRRVSSVAAPLGGIFLIRHGAATCATPLGPVDAARRLVPRCFHPYWDRDALAALLATVGGIVDEVPCHELPFVPTLDTVLPVIDAAGRSRHG